MVNLAYWRTALHECHFPFNVAPSQPNMPLQQGKTESESDAHPMWPISSGFEFTQFQVSTISVLPVTFFSSSCFERFRDLDPSAASSIDDNPLGHRHPVEVMFGMPELEFNPFRDRLILRHLGFDSTSTILSRISDIITRGQGGVTC